MNIYAFGGYGANNVGDEAIFEGLKVVYPNATEIYVNKSRRNGIWYADLFEGRKRFLAPGHLIVGGGGIAHCLGAVQDHLKMIRLAKSQGLTASIERVGLTELQPEWTAATVELLSEVDSISVRSNYDRLIARKLGFETLVERDFAYEIPWAATGQLPYSVKTIAVSLSPLKESDFPVMAERLRRILKHADVLFIPHSKAYVSYENNDLATAQKLWSMCNTWAFENVFAICDLYAPAGALYTYECANGVYTSRYHGYVFADIVKKPVFAQITGLKARSFFDDGRNDLSTTVDQGIPEDQFLKELEEWVQGL